jgi:hypothetical protein
MRKPLLLVVAAVVAASCSRIPTSANPPTRRFDGGNTMGSGNSVPTDSTQRGGNTMGSGN